mgnify:CR=1 FL=1
MKVFNPIALKGERIAALYLRNKGFKILESNFRKGYGELDIIATDKDTLVFIEVKTRTSSKYGNPLEAITPWKLKSLVKTAQYYKITHPKLPDRLRIDAVAVSLIGGQIKNIEHVKNISA